VIAHGSLSDSDVRRTCTGQNDQDAGSSTAPEHLDAGWSTPISSTPGPRRRRVALTPMAGLKARDERAGARLDRDVSVTRPVPMASDLRRHPHHLTPHQEVPT
jgi:hypothetical protein